MFYIILWPFVWLFTHMLCRYKVIGRQHIPRKGAVLVVANHQIWYDPLLLGLIFPRRLWFMAKIEIFQTPLVGAGCRLTGQIPVRRGAGDRVALEAALAYLRAGKAVTIFPEGAVEQQERLLVAQTGVAMLALRSGVPILPVAHTGTRRVFTRRGFWMSRVEVHIGEPYLPGVPAGLSRKAALKLITEDLMVRIAHMLPAEERGAYQVPAGTPERETQEHSPQPGL
jgi:1-acyl-sn-glycerol-3-phosphate acyltransferase